MPYEIKKIKSGYKVCKVSNPDECFSKNPIPMKNAIKQKYAIEISERSKKGGADSEDEEEEEEEDEEEEEEDEEENEIRNLFKIRDEYDNDPFIKGKTLIYEKDKIRKLYNYLLPLLQKAYKKRIGLIANFDDIGIKGNELDSELETLQLLVKDFPSNIFTWCKGAHWRHRFIPSAYKVVGLSMELGDDDEILFTCAACCKIEGDRLYLAYLCGVNAYLITNAMKDSMNEGINPFFVTAKFRYVGLNSADTCNTIEFYNKQGFLTANDEYNKIHDTFKDKFDELVRESDDFSNAISIIEDIFSSEKNSCSDKIQDWFSSIDVGTYFVLLNDQEDKSGYSSIDFYNEIRNKWIPEIVSEHEEEIKAKKQKAKSYYKKFKDQKLMKEDKFVEEFVKLDNGDYTIDEILEQISESIPKKKKVGKGIKGTKFYEQLKKLGIDEKKYIIAVKVNAKKNKYDPKLLDYAMDDVHKLKYFSPEGVKYFGRVGYGDFFIYKALEGLKKIEKGTADKKRKVFHKSHEAITKKHNLGVYSPNELALNILW